MYGVCVCCMGCLLHDVDRFLHMWLDRKNVPSSHFPPIPTQIKSNNHKSRALLPPRRAGPGVPRGAGMVPPAPLPLGAGGRTELAMVYACVRVSYVYVCGVDGMDMHAILDLSSPKPHHPPILQNTYTTATRRPRRSTAPSSTSTRPHPPAPLRRRRRPPRRWGGSKSSSSSSHPSSLSGLSTSIT